MAALQRVAVVGGDERIARAVWPANVTPFPSARDGGKRSIDKLKQGLKNRRFGTVVILAKWCGHGVQEIVRNFPNVRLIVWKHGLNELVKQLPDLLAHGTSVTIKASKEIVMPVKLSRTVNMIEEDYSAEVHTPTPVNVPGWVREEMDAVQLALQDVGDDVDKFMGNIRDLKIGRTQFDLGTLLTQLATSDVDRTFADRVMQWSEKSQVFCDEFTVPQAAPKLKLSKGNLYRMVRQNIVPARVNNRGLLVVNLDDVRAGIAAQQVKLREIHKENAEKMNAAKHMNKTVKAIKPVALKPAPVVRTDNQWHLDMVRLTVEGVEHGHITKSVGFDTIVTMLRNAKLL